jgi:hypothetical protein
MTCEECDAEEDDTFVEILTNDGILHFCETCAPEYTECRRCALLVEDASGLLDDRGLCQRCLNMDEDEDY